MPSTNRISVTTASATHQKLLEYEAFLTGRSISSLASSLLEEIVNQKIQSGQLHPTAVRLSEEVIKEREFFLAEEHTANLGAIREDITSPPNRGEEEQSCMDEMLEWGKNPAFGFYSDGVWKAKSVNPLDEEFIEYGIKYGMEREEAEDFLENVRNNKSRSELRKLLREQAGWRHSHRLPEGDFTAADADPKTGIIHCDPDGIPFGRI